MHEAVSESPFSHRRESIKNFQGGSGAIGTECGAQLITLSLHLARGFLESPFYSHLPARILRIEGQSIAGRRAIN
jgi:hypothetical protein